MKTESMRMPCPLTERLDARLAAFAALGAVAAVGGLDQKAEASIVSSGPVNIAIPVNTSGIYLNVVTGVTNSNPVSVPGWDVNPYGTANLILYSEAPPAGGAYAMFAGNFNLPVGTLVDATSTYSSSGNFGIANLNSNNNYIGFRFQNEALGNQIEYGWIQIHLGATTIDPARSIIAYAYENTGAGINVGTTPAPSAGMAVLALGGAGLLRRRRVA